MAKRFFSQRGVQYQEKDVSRDRAAAMEMVQRSGQQGVPVILVDGEVIVGMDRGRLEQALARSAKARVSLGASVAGAEAVARQRGILMPPGAYLGQVRPGSPAARAGLHEGDVIVALNGVDVRGSSDLERVLGSLSPGQTVTVAYWRDGRETSGRLSV